MPAAPSLPPAAPSLPSKIQELKQRKVQLTGLQLLQVFPQTGQSFRHESLLLPSLLL